MGYVIFDPKVDRPLHQVSRTEAREAFNWFIANIDNRIGELSRLVSADGIVLDFSLVSVVQLHDWFYELVLEERELGNSLPSPELFSVCNDIGIYLSELVIKHAPTVTWEFYTKHIRDLSYQRPVISGFKVKNPDYHIDFDYLICQYAVRILKSGTKEDERLPAMVKKALSISV